MQGRFSEEQIIAVLKEAEPGAKVTELCRRHGISDAAFYTWHNKYSAYADCATHVRAPASLGNESWKVPEDH